MSLQEEYQEKLVPQLMKELGVKNPLAVPTLRKITVNIGVGQFKSDANYLKSAAEDLAVIAGQRPNPRRARQSIAAFKLREGEKVGLAATLRGQRMWAFMEKLIRVVFPRVKDFRGLSRRSFDGSGNYSLGFPEQTVFPEIDSNKVDRIKPLQVTITTTATDDRSGCQLLQSLGMPFKKEANFKFKTV